MKRRLAPMVALAAALMTAGCASEPEIEADLALFCQVKKCACRMTKVVIFEEVEPMPVQWRQNGDAYCPEDYELTPIEGKSSTFKSRYGG